MTTCHEKKTQATSEAKHIAWIRENTAINSRSALFIVIIILCVIAFIVYILCTY